MSCLFIGNLIKATNESKLTNVFRSFGKCNVEMKGPYAFVEYEDAENAKMALRDLNKTNLKGANGMAKARIEFSYKKRGNGRLEENDTKFAEDEDVFSSHSDEEDFKRKDKNKNYSHKYNGDSKNKFSKKDENKINDKYDKNDEDDNLQNKRRNVCFICRLPGHIAKDCILTKDSCFECGEKGHIAKECHMNVREAKNLTENRVKAINSQQSAFKYVTPDMKIKNIINYLQNKNRQE